MLFTLQVLPTLLHPLQVGNLIKLRWRGGTSTWLWASSATSQR